ncbi:HNH endonuclease, partial [Clostridium sp.]|uniref:HNH endonuclease n=1 Tax=Clostridium sp. TaxID=1506 RepID=UPI003F33446E
MNQDEAKKHAFHNEMINLYKTISKQLKYKSTKLLDMINKYGGYEAAIKFIKSESNTFDFTILWENERLDLSVEALITNPKHRDLFPEEVVSFCDRKLKDYNFSPRKIEEPKEAPIENEKVFNDLVDQMPTIMPIENKKEYILLNRPIDIDKETWKQLFSSDTVFPAKNKDLILRLVLINGYVEADEISKEEGYNSKYPYKEVVMALAKRIKAKTKIDVPLSRKGEMLWWHILFLGGFKDNNCFEWRVRPELKKAVEELSAEGKVDLSNITVQTHKEFEEVEEEIQVINNADLKKEIITTLPIEVKEELPQEEVTQPKEISIKKEEVPIKKVIKEDASLDNFIDSLLSDMDSKPKKKEIPMTKPKDPFAFPEIETADNLLHDLEDDSLEAFIEEMMMTKQEDSSHEKVTLPVEFKKETQEIQEIQETPKIINQAKENDSIKLENQQENTDEWQKLKEECIEYYGAICEICGFDYGYTYGEAFEKNIGIHHVQAKDDKEEYLPNTDAIKDLIPICDNCHGIIHSKTPPYTVEEMRKMLK